VSARAGAVTVLGSTGSIGCQTLEVMGHLGLRPAALSANSDVETMEAQAREFLPAFVAMADEKAAAALRVKLADTPVRVRGGADAVIEAAAFPGADIVVTALLGIAGLRPTLAAVGAGKHIALANKETLVCAGEIVMRAAREKNVRVLPVDSEHSAIFQCLEANYDKGAVKKLILTASGGPFFGMTKDQLESVTLAQALSHPNWRMGAKITVDSATMLNKGLEIIEAMHLYGVPPDKIEVVVHRESIVHSMVEFKDNSVLAQLGLPDMRLPIEYALCWPDRGGAIVQPLDLTRVGALTFFKPDADTFVCLKAAIQAANAGGMAPAVLNGANEAAVSLFLQGKIGFADIGRIVSEALDAVVPAPGRSLEAVFAADAAAREFALTKTHNI